MKEFDEKEAIKAMRDSVSTESSSLYDDDELLNVIDIIWDWYDDQGLLDIDTETDDDNINSEALIIHLCIMIEKDSW